jgi:catechol 2,3-dioxygenase-like lactoylglutathione lyase family enzyme
VGGHHVALTTNDLDATVRFYHEAIGMELVGAFGPGEGHGAHVLLRAGDYFVHFFHQPENPVQPVPAGWSALGFRIIPGFLQHLALAVATEEDLLAFHERLLAAGVECSALIEQPPLRQLFFSDNNGIVWEINWSRVTLEELDGMLPEARDALLFPDPDPVPAVREIRAGRFAGSGRGS